MLNNIIYLPGEVLFISDIGSQPDDRSDPGSTLVCVTSSINTTCCNNGAVVEWFYPNFTTVPHGDDESTSMDFATFRYTNQIRLAREVADSAPPVGVYTCKVSEISTGTINASITIQVGKFTEIIQKPGNNLAIIVDSYLAYHQ